VLFGDTTLAARIDRAEADLCAAVARAATPDALARPLAGGFAVYAKPGSPVNKVVGVGFGEPLNDETLATVEEEWRALNEPVRVELSVLSEAANGIVLTKRGYRLMGFEHVMGRYLSPNVDQFNGEHAHVDGLTIHPVLPPDVPVWREVTVTGFLHLDGTGTGSEDVLTRDSLEQIMSDFVEAPGFQRFLARLDGDPAGAASMRVDREVAQLSGATTLPAFRRRGIQTALLQSRLDYARRAGSDLAVVTTQPGSRSQANSQRQGFQLLYARAILVKSWNNSE
jgi:GNAT superfamily N-acetyltransferase